MPSSYVAAISLVVKTVNFVLKRMVMFWPKAKRTQKNEKIRSVPYKKIWGSLSWAGLA